MRSPLPFQIPDVLLVDLDSLRIPPGNQLEALRGDTALRLEQLFGMEAQFWLNLQLAWDLYEVKHSTAVKEIQKIMPLISKAS